MGSFSDWTEGAILDHVFKTGAMSQPTNLYIALAKSTITDAHTGSTLPGQVTNKGYARKICNTWDACSGAGATENSQVVTFAAATADWGVMTDFAVCNHLTTGNVIVYGKLTVSKNVQNGDTLKFATGDIDITLT